MFRVFSGGGADAATKFCTEIDNQCLSSNMEKINKINDVIILRNLAKKTVKRAYFKKSLLFLHLLFNPTETLQKH